MKTGMKLLLAGTFALAAVTLLGQQDASAAITGRCDSCHTMHNSQDGTHMTTGTTTAQNQLLRTANGCIGCHTGADGTSAVNSFPAPIVVHESDPLPGTAGNNYLAGGSFFYIEDGGYGDRYGHNVQGLTNPTDAVFPDTNPPGGDYADSGAGQMNSRPLGCADIAGSESGCHYAGGHHTNEGGDYGSPAVTVGVSGSGVGGSFRFLSGGTLGGEDGDWEWTKTGNLAQDHNVYQAGATYLGSAGSITAVCVRCHGNFHGNGDGAGGDGVEGPTGGQSPWIRHPTDFNLLSGTNVSAEHQSYESYSIVTPIGDSAAVPAGTLTMTGYNEASGTFAMVLCQSCHRAHGSENLDMLRFSYATSAAGSSGTTGCLKCHRDKN